MNGKRFCIIYNTEAGRGLAGNYAQKARQFLESQGAFTQLIIETAFAGDAQARVQTFTSYKFDFLVVVGGDGLLREVIGGLIEAGLKIPIRLVPVGNANVIAREHRIPLNPIKAIEKLCEGDVETMDAGSFCSDHVQGYFIAMLETGIGADIVRYTETLRYGRLKRLYRLWGDIVYAIAALLALTRHTQTDLDIYTDQGQVRGLCYRCVVSCTKTYAKGWSLTPELIVNQGKFGLSASLNASMFSYLQQMLAASQVRKLDKKWIVDQNTSFVEMNSDAGMSIQIDGEALAPSMSLSAEIIPQAYLLYVYK